MTDAQFIILLLCILVAHSAKMHLTALLFSIALFFFFFLRYIPMKPHIWKSTILGTWFCCQYRSRTWLQNWAMGATPAEAYRNYMRRAGHK